MSYRSGHETQRRPIAEHRGYSIIKVTELTYHRSLWGDGYDRHWIDKKEIYYRFCAIGEEKRPSCDYMIQSKDVLSVRERIDSMLDKGEVILTHGEYQKYVKGPNIKNDYGFSLQELLKLMEKHKNGDSKTKYIIEERLTDANYHSECGLLCENYDKFKDYVLKKHALKEKFEVYTFTEDVKRITDPKRFEEGLAKVISDYLASQGVKDTSVNVRFMENW